MSSRLPTSAVEPVGLARRWSRRTRGAASASTPRRTGAGCVADALIDASGRAEVVGDRLEQRGAQLVGLGQVRPPRRRRPAGGGRAAPARAATGRCAARAGRRRSSCGPAQHEHGAAVVDRGPMARRRRARWAGRRPSEASTTQPSSRLDSSATRIERRTWCAAGRAAPAAGRARRRGCRWCGPAPPPRRGPAAPPGCACATRSTRTLAPAARPTNTTRATTFSGSPIGERVDRRRRRTSSTSSEGDDGGGDADDDAADGGDDDRDDEVQQQVGRQRRRGRARPRARRVSSGRPTTASDASRRSGGAGLRTAATAPARRPPDAGDRRARRRRLGGDHVDVERPAPSRTIRVDHRPAQQLVPAAAPAGAEHDLRRLLGAGELDERAGHPLADDLAVACRRARRAGRAGAASAGPARACEPVATARRARR